MIATEVGSLWRSPQEGENTWSGQIVLPYPLPAGVSLKAILVPHPFKRSLKEKFTLHLEIPYESPPEPPGPDDINCDKRGGRTMSQWFRAAKPSNRRHKILIWGLSGSAKTKSALEFPGCAYIDNHGSAEKYESAYPQHLFFGSASEPPTPDNTMAAVTSLLSDPGDRRTLALDDITTYWDQVQGKWSNLFLKRLPKSPGHRAEFYQFQPSDWQHPKRELRSLIRRMIALDMNVIVIARAQKEYAAEGGNFMKVVGEIFAGEKGLPYEFDFIFQFVHEAGESGGKYQAIVHKQRTTPGEKPMPESFDFHIDKKGRSTFYDEFSKYVDKEKLNQESHVVVDPVKEEGAVETAPPEMPPPAIEKLGPSDRKPQPGTPLDGNTPKVSVELGPVATEPPTGEIQGITKDQLDQLVALKAKFNIQKEEWDTTLTKMFNATSARFLSSEQATELVNYLEKVRVPF